MSASGCTKVEILVGDMQRTIDTMWAMCRKNAALNRLMYAGNKNERQDSLEVREIVRMLGSLKRLAESLSEECASANVQADEAAAEEDESRTVVTLCRELAARLLPNHGGGEPAQSAPAAPTDGFVPAESNRNHYEPIC